LALSPRRRIAFLPASLRRIPHLPAFWPEHEPAASGAEILALPEGEPPPRGAPPQRVHFAAGPLRSPAFASRLAPVALLLTDGLPSCLGAVPLTPPPPADDAAVARGLAVARQLAEARIGGEPGLPDPGAAALRMPRHGAVLLLDPCDPGRAEAARTALAQALSAAQGRPVLLARDPAAAPGQRMVLAAPAGARLLDARLSPWTLLDLAADLHGASAEMALLAAAAGVPVAGQRLDAGPRFAALVAATRCADPFLRQPWSLEQALGQLAAWKRVIDENRPVTICLGMSWWKRDRIAALFAHPGGAPGFARTPEAALRQARAQRAQLGQATVASWARAVPPDFRARCQSAGVALLTVEDGFVRSRGLGARFLPGASYAVDARGIYYDPAAPSALEDLLACAEFPPELLARAAALRQAIVGRGVTKYNLAGTAPSVQAPPGKLRLLVPGQVEDDASVRLGGGAIQSNLALLRRVRAACPDAFIIYKPHPDLEAGFRKGHVAADALAAVADQVVSRAPLTGLLGQVDAVHTLTSLSGFEALLRGVPVVTWGQPFYAGWGLTEDRNPPPRRGRRLELDALVAAALILFPRQVDPVTELPCPPEVILERLGDPAAWKLPKLSLYRGLEGFLRGGLARLWGRT
jgi:capsular polysaccharide export protein